MHIGKRVRHFRKLKGWSQDALAESAGLQRNTINRLERASKSSLDTLVSVIAALDITIEEFFSAYGAKGISSEHQELHRKLQTILDTGGNFEVGIRLNVEEIYEGAIGRQLVASKKGEEKSSQSATGTEN